MTLAVHIECTQPVKKKKKKKKIVLVPVLHAFEGQGPDSF